MNIKNTSIILLICIIFVILILFFINTPSTINNGLINISAQQTKNNNSHYNLNDSNNTSNIDKFTQYEKIINNGDCNLINDNMFMDYCWLQKGRTNILACNNIIHKAIYDLCIQYPIERLDLT